LKVAVKIFDYFFVSKSFHAALEDNKKSAIEISWQGQEKDDFGG